MLFRICLCLAIFVATLLAQGTDVQTKVKQLEEEFKNGNLNVEQKRAKFNEFLTSLGGDYKEKYDALITDMKTELASINNEKVRALGDKIIAQFDSGAWLNGSDENKAMISKEVTAAQLTDADRADMKGIREQFMQKFQSLFKNIFHKALPPTSAPPT